MLALLWEEGHTRTLFLCAMYACYGYSIQTHLLATCLRLLLHIFYSFPYLPHSLYSMSSLCSLLLPAFILLFSVSPFLPYSCLEGGRTCISQMLLPTTYSLPGASPPRLLPFSHSGTHTCPTPLPFLQVPNACLYHLPAFLPHFQQTTETFHFIGCSIDIQKELVPFHLTCICAKENSLPFPFWKRTAIWTPLGKNFLPSASFPHSPSHPS